MLSPGLLNATYDFLNDKIRFIHFLKFIKKKKKRFIHSFKKVSMNLYLSIRDTFMTNYFARQS